MQRPPNQTAIDCLDETILLCAQDAYIATTLINDSKGTNANLHQTVSGFLESLDKIKRIAGELPNEYQVPSMVLNAVDQGLNPTIIDRFEVDSTVQDSDRARSDMAQAEIFREALDSLLAEYYNEIQDYGKENNNNNNNASKQA